MPPLLSATQPKVLYALHTRNALNALDSLCSPTQVQYILNASVTATARDPARRFHWAEIVFFQRWFDALDEPEQQTVRRLVANGQLEFVHGGYVMEDEASTTPAARIHQLTVRPCVAHWLTRALAHAHGPTRALALERA